MSLRILADDLTGALDSAARTVAAFGPLPVYWTMPATPTDAFVFDSGTREANRETAVAAVRRIAPLLRGDNVAFKKIDSLFRGNTAAEIAATVADQFEAAIIAPAFPDQGRRTRDGRQWIVAADGAETCVPVDLAAELAAFGHRVSLCRPGDRVPAGLSLWDARSNADLAAIVTAGHRFAHPLLWCGTAGLAGALAGFRSPIRQPFAEPLLGIFGSDSAVTRRQLAALGSRVRRATPPFEAAVYDLTPNEPTMPREEAARRITAAMAQLCDVLPRPASLLVSGGETLRALCAILGADHLVVDGEFEPGVPMSILVGGRWDGVRILSKSGAFGDTDLLCRIIDAARPRRDAREQHARERDAQKPKGAIA